MTQPDKMRQAFEAYVLSKPGANAITICRRDFPGSDRIGEYISLSVEFGWLSWQAATAQATAARWMPIETAPHGRKLIVGYYNKLGNWRTVMASHYAEETLPAPDYYRGDKEFADAGWFEECESNDEVIYPCEEEPSHWMPLPPPPATASGTDPAEVAR